MTPEAQKIAIAEACKWNIHLDGNYCSVPNAQGTRLRGLLFNPLEDLNTMHEAEKTLPPTRRGYFNAELFKIATQRPLSSAIKEAEFIFSALHATAAQRAEAFLRTIGKWKDE